MSKDTNHYNAGIAMTWVSQGWWTVLWTVLCIYLSLFFYSAMPAIPAMPPPLLPVQDFPQTGRLENSKIGRTLNIKYFQPANTSFDLLTGNNWLKVHILKLLLSSVGTTFESFLTNSWNLISEIFWNVENKLILFQLIPSTKAPFSSINFWHLKFSRTVFAQSDKAQSEIKQKQRLI